MDGVRKFNAYVVQEDSPQSGSEPVQIGFYTTDGTPLAVGAEMPVQADSVAADVATLKTDFNALLTKLKNAGLMASS